MSLNHMLEVCPWFDCLVLVKVCFLVLFLRFSGVNSGGHWFSRPSEHASPRRD